VRAEAETVLQAAPDRVFAVLADLGTWPAWLDVVARSEPDGPRAWRVRLGLSIGPASVGYDVRMVRVVAVPGEQLRFERDERDGRDNHSMVVIEVDLVATGTCTTSTLKLEVDKRIPLLDLQRQLDRRAARATRRLQRLLDER
jgi:uncharacterized protein YndB with AHSA1/START domain